MTGPASFVILTPRGPSGRVGSICSGRLFSLYCSPMATKAAQAADTTPPAEPQFGQFGRISIDQIIVPEEHKRPLGDIEDLAQTIAQEGMLQPVIVRQTPE